MSFEQKYGIVETTQVKSFHASRRMFCIKDNVLHIAESNLDYSHAVWFEKEGWMSKEDDRFMDHVTRGFVDDAGDIYFYAGYDFRVTDEIERIFFEHLQELVSALKLQGTGKIFGGLIKQSVGGAWPARNDYGIIEQWLCSAKTQ